MSDTGFGKKVREAKNHKIPYWIVIGDKELEAKKVTLESRDKGKVGEFSPTELAQKLSAEIESKTL